MYAWQGKETKKTGIDLSGMSNFTPPPQPKGVDGFLDACAECGLIIDELIADGKVHRVDVAGDKNKSKNGWYVLFSDNVMAGSFGNWKLGITEKWCELSYESMSDVERHDLKRQMENAAKMREAEQLIIHDEKAALANSIWGSAHHPVESHPYLTAKGVKPYGIRLHKDRLAIPLYDESEAMRSMQFIAPDGSKRFLSGGQKRGLAFVINGDTSLVVICEGYSTGATIHEATNATVFVAFDAGNLKPVSEWVRKIHPHVVIGADDDAFTENNPGITKAEETGLPVIKPAFLDTSGNPTDFNDQYQKQGLEAVRECFIRKNEVYKIKDEDSDPIDDDLINPPFKGMRDIVDYYNGTSNRPQPLFAVQTALAVGSTMLARRFKTNYDNYSALYLLNVALSATGKEHPKTVIEDILGACGKSHMVANDGFTSPAAVFSALHARPACVSTIDEFGLYMKEAGSSRSSNVGEANAMLMQAIGRCHGSLRPRNYSTVTASKDEAERVNKKLVVKPSLTLVAGTTPGTFFDNVSKDQIKDGFLGRFICMVSHAKRTPMNILDDVNPAYMESIKLWSASISKRIGEGNLASIVEPDDDVTQEVITFSKAADSRRYDFECYCIDLMNELDDEGIAEIVGRTCEMAMRIALIVALFDDPETKTVECEHMDWGARYVDYCLQGLLKAVRKNMHGSQFEKDKMEILEALRKRGAKGLTERERHRIPPFSKVENRAWNDIIYALIQSGCVADLDVVNDGKRGARRIAWVAIKRRDK